MANRWRSRSSRLMPFAFVLIVILIVISCGENIHDPEGTFAKAARGGAARLSTTGPLASSRIVAERPCSVDFTFTGPRGGYVPPIPGVRIEVSRHGIPILDTITEADGWTTVPLPAPGRYGFEVIGQLPRRSLSCSYVPPDEPTYANVGLNMGPAIVELQIYCTN
ncbi:MAG: hypothetical protein IPK13_22960 [Deltaproteobacteria bacterium]|nr:hypothetical protein [Deltaproteobacteria bacterium]